MHSTYNVVCIVLASSTYNITYFLMGPLLIAESREGRRLLEDEIMTPKLERLEHCCIFLIRIRRVWIHSSSSVVSREPSTDKKLPPVLPSMQIYSTLEYIILSEYCMCMHITYV